MTSKQRVRSTLAGRRPDRPAFSFWYHFPAEQVTGPAAVQAHLDQLAAYGMDFVKVMNDNPYPHERPIRSVADLGGLAELRGDEGGFGRQIELITRLRERVGGEVLLCTTIFNAWAVLRNLIEPPKEHLPPVMGEVADGPSQWIRDALTRDEQAVARAVNVIAASLANFAWRCTTAGADGIYLSVRQDWVEPTEAEAGLYGRLVRPADLRILDGARAAELNILHVCGTARELREFNDYPVAALNWADRMAGPSIREVAGWMKPTMCAGVDNLRTLCDGSEQDVRDEVEDALLQAGDRPMIVAPGCTFDPKRVPAEYLRALAEAAKGWRW